jgi:hypothetical protein
MIMNIKKAALEKAAFFSFLNSIETYFKCALQNLVQNFSHF